MKKVTLFLLVMMGCFILQSAITQQDRPDQSNVEIKQSPRSLYDVYSPTGNPSGDYIYVYLTNGSLTYYFTLPPYAAANYVLGQIEGTCNYSVTLTSSGAAHTMQFYYFYPGKVVTATSDPGMCLDCGSCPTLNIYD